MRIIVFTHAHTKPDNIKFFTLSFKKVKLKKNKNRLKMG